MLLVKSDPHIEYRHALVILGFAVFHKAHIPRLAILVRRVIRDVDSLAMVPFPVPVVQEPDGLLPADGFQEAADFHITVDPHPVREQRMAEGKVRIILAGIVFVDDKIGNQVHKQAAILLEPALQYLRKLTLLQYLAYDDIRTNPQGTAAVRFRAFLRHDCVREELLVFLVGIHARQVIRQPLADNGAQRDYILLLRLVELSVLKQNVGGGAFGFLKDFPLHLGDWYREIVIHCYPLS